VSYLFVFRAGPDVDHFTPLAWKLLEAGEEVHAVVTPGFEPAGDHRIELLAGYPRFHLDELRPAGAGALRRLAGYLRSTVPGALLTLRRRRAVLLFVEWGSGLRTGFDRLASPAGAAAVAGSTARSFTRARSDPRAQVRMSFIVAARLLRIPAVCLPHGLSVKLDAPTDEAAQLVAGGGLDWSDRNRFAAYVLNTEHHRRIHLESAKGDPEVMQTWGSLRWDPAWFELNRGLVAPYAWPEATARPKVVFMVPKWRNRVDAAATVDLFKRLHARDDISLAVMGHPRPGQGAADPLRADPDIHWERVHDVSGVSSPALIAAADIVIDVGSSIGIEVVMQGKVLINPEYLHAVATLFDTIPGCCVVAHAAADVEGYLGEHVAGRPHVTSPEALAALLRDAVYGGREPYDVLDLHLRRVRSLARR
jgi:hypothetical protein